LQSNKVLNLLRSLNSKEFKEFNRFLNSPFFNTNPRIVSLYEQLKKYYPAFDSPKLAREKLYKKIFPTKTYHYQQMANLVSELTRLIEAYFIQLSLKDDPFQQKKILSESYQRRELFEPLKKLTFDLLTELNSAKKESSLLQNYLVLKNYFFRPQKDNIWNDESILLKLVVALDQFYFQEKLILTGEIKSRAAILKSDIEIPLLAEIKEIVAQDPNNHILYTYFLLLEILDNQNETNYQQLKNYFQENYHHLPNKLSITIFRILTNYCSRQINKGNDIFYSEQFQLYQLGLSAQLILYNNIISAPTFINIIFVAIYTKREVWALEFMKKYQPFLNPSIKEEVLQVTTAITTYFHKDFKETISILLPFNSNNLSRTFTVKKLLIRSYFELFLIDKEYYDLFLSSCLSFEKYLRRNNQSNSERIKANLNFIYFLKKISKAILEGNFKTEKRKALLEEINKNSNLILKYWLVKKIT